MGAGASTQIAEKVGPATEADLKAAFTELSQADKDKLAAAAKAPAAEAPSTDAPAADAADASAAEGPDVLTYEQAEELRKKVAAENAAAYEKAKKTGTFLKEGDLEKIRQKQKDFANDLLEAKKLESTPSWVDGPRPSDELLAMGEPSKPPPDTPEDYEEFAKNGPSKEWGFPGFTKLIIESRAISVLDDDGKFELPSSFKVEPVDADGVQCCWCNWPGTNTSKGAIFFIHGGGGFMGDIWAGFCARLSCISGLRVLAVDLRLVPENHAKDAVEDMVKAYLWLTKTTPAEQTAIYGHSFGGWGVMATLQALLKQDKKPACAVSESPILPQFGLNNGCWEMLAQIRSWDGLVPDAKLSIKEVKEDPFFNILDGQLKGLPPMYVSVGGLEHVERQRKPAKALAEALKNAGVQVEFELVRNLGHTPCGHTFVVPEATAYVARIATFMNKCLAGDGAK